MTCKRVAHEICTAPSHMHRMHLQESAAGDLQVLQIHRLDEATKERKLELETRHCRQRPWPGSCHRNVATETRPRQGLQRQARLYPGPGCAHCASCSHGGPAVCRLRRLRDEAGGPLRRAPGGTVQNIRRLPVPVPVSCVRGWGLRLRSGCPSP